MATVYRSGQALKEEFDRPASVVWLTDSGLASDSTSGRDGPHVYAYYDTGATTDLVLLEAKSTDMWVVKSVAVSERAADQGLFLTFGDMTASPFFGAYFAADGGGRPVEFDCGYARGAAGESVQLTRAGTESVCVSVHAYVDEGITVTNV